MEHAKGDVAQEGTSLGGSEPYVYLMESYSGWTKV